MLLSSRLAFLEESSTLALNARAQEMAKQGADIINLTVGEPDQPVPDFVKDAMIKSLGENRTKYGPAAGDMELRRAISGFYSRHYNLDLEPSGFLIMNGAKQVIFNAVLALLNPGEVATVIKPYWLSYPSMVKAAEGRVAVWSPEEDGCPKSKILFLNYPCNPSSETWAGSRIVPLVNEFFKVNPDGIIISDEIYETLTFGAKHTPLLTLFPNRLDQIILASGLSKSFSMTGLRVGFAYVANPVLRAKLIALQSHSTSNVNTVAQRGAIAALTLGDEYLEEFCRTYEQRAQKAFASLQDFLPKVAAQCKPPGGAFYLWFPAPEPHTARSFCELALEKAHVAMVPGDDFGDPKMVRASFACESERFTMAMERLGKLIS